MRLSLAVAADTLSAFDEIRLRCALRNDGAVEVVAPGPFDRSGAFRLMLYNSGEEPLRRMDRQTRQAVLNGGRIDASPDMLRLAPGEGWDCAIDLASFHYPIPPGEYLLQAQCDYAEGSATAESRFVPVRVTGGAPTRVMAVRDNPIIDTTTLLFESEGAAGPEYYLRQHNYSRPLGAWYSRRILAGRAASDPFPAAAAFFQSDSIDLAYRKWVVWMEDGRIAAGAFQNGTLDEGSLRRVQIPESLVLVPAAFWTIAEELYVFFRADGTKLECHRFESDRLVKVFEHRLRSGEEWPLAIGADEQESHVVSAWRGLLYDRLDYRGKLLERLHVFRSRQVPRLITIDASERRIKALFSERGKGTMVQMVRVDLREEQVSSYSIDRLVLRGEAAEFSFDCDFKGRFHLLVSTTARALYYFSEERGPILVAEGEDRFYPILCAPQQVYIGFQRRDFGFRFVQYQRRRTGSKFVGLEANPAIL